MSTTELDAVSMAIPMGPFLARSPSPVIEKITQRGMREERERKERGMRERGRREE